MPLKLLEVTLPLLINGAFCVLMSSVGGVSARLGARRLLDAVYENGTKIVKALNWAKPCDECVRKGRGARCKCNVQQPQSYQNHVDVDKVQRLMAALNTGAGARELMNQEETPSVVPLFMARDLEVLRDRSADVTFTTPVHKVFVGVDPGTHAFSQTAIVSVVPVGESGRVEQVVLFT